MNTFDHVDMTKELEMVRNGGNAPAPKPEALEEAAYKNLNDAVRNFRTDMMSAVGPIIDELVYATSSGKEFRVAQTKIEKEVSNCVEKIKKIVADVAKT